MKERYSSEPFCSSPAGLDRRECERNLDQHCWDVQCGSYHSYVILFAIDSVVYSICGFLELRRFCFVQYNTIVVRCQIGFELKTAASVARFSMKRIEDFVLYFFFFYSTVFFLCGLICS